MQGFIIILTKRVAKAIQLLYIILQRFVEFCEQGSKTQGTGSLGPYCTSAEIEKSVQTLIKEKMMLKTLTTASAASLLLASQSLFADARVAVGHFAPFADTLDGTAVNVLVDGTPTLENVRFKDFTDYLVLPAGSYTVDIVPVGATDPAISGSFDLMDDTSYSLVAIGNGVTQDLDLLALVDDASMPAAGNLNLRIVHTAPFAADLEATEVSIRTDGGDIVNGLVGVPYEVSSGFFEVPAGTYDLKVASNDGSVNYIDILPAELPAGADVTVYAVGDGINQPLGVIAFPVGELPTTTPVDNRSNGMWEILEGTGTGFVLQPMPSQNRLVGTWYTYDAMGAPFFLTFDSCMEQTDDMGGTACATPGAFDGVTATTSLYLSTGGGPSEDAVITTEKVGEIDFEILGCNDAMATVRLDGEEPAMYTAKQLTRPFPCTDES
jgi:hypothetical protein